MASRYQRHLRAIEGEPLPCAYVDLDAFDANARLVVEKVRAADKTLRPATKSVRVPELLKRVAEIGGETVRGLMTYTARETAWLAEQGFTDLLLGYPTLQENDAVALARAAKRTLVRVVCDAREQVEAIGAAAIAEGSVVGIVAEVDLAFRPMGSRLHLGVRRSPLRMAEDIAAFADTVARVPGVRFSGVMGYEAHIAGVSDEELGKRLLRRVARHAVEETRESITRLLRARGHEVEVFNGGGSGSLDWTASEAAITEVTAGSAFLDSHLFDGYRDLPLTPAAHFALQVVRRPTVGIVACAGGGYIASGAMGPDRLPVVAFPLGAKLLPLEGAGEVQTPVALARGDNLSLGSAVILRHAKAGELAEHFDQYVLIRGETVERRVPTYRGLGLNFLG
ncbi:MAG: alanine racemase [Polyangiales bacterium]